MIQAKPVLLFPVAAALTLAGCANSGTYPSLAIRDAERVRGSFTPVEPEPYIPPPPTAQVVDRLGQLRADAAAAHQRFLAAAERARRPVAAARNAKPGDEAWSVAEVALADLDSSRSQAMIALADLDHLYATAETEGTQSADIEAARGEVADLVATEDSVIDRLYGQMGS